MSRLHLRRMAGFNRRDPFHTDAIHKRKWRLPSLRPGDVTPCPSEPHGYMRVLCLLKQGHAYVIGMMEWIIQR